MRGPGPGTVREIFRMPSNLFAFTNVGISVDPNSFWINSKQKHDLYI